MTKHPSKNLENQASLPESALQILRQRARVLQLVDAAERAGITPISSRKLHAFAYLADVLSPVWNLPSFDGKILKLEGGPHYPDLQREMDRLVILGLLQITEMKYIERDNYGARLDASYALNFESPELSSILEALGARSVENAFDARDARVHLFLVDLASALATVKDADLDEAATVDATYADARFDYSNIVDFGEWTENSHEDNLSLRTVDNFRRFVPEGFDISGGQKLYMYASLLGRRMHAG
jgi:hypothetical protein